MLWILYSLIAAIFQSGSELINKKILSHEHALEFGASRGAFSLLLIFALPFIDWSHPWGYYVGIFVIAVMLAAGNLYYLKSLRHSELSSTVPLMNISPLFLLVIAFILLKETPGVMGIVGVLLLITGAYVLQIASSPGQKGLFGPFKALVRSKYALYMLFAMLIFSFTATLQKAIMNEGFDVLTFFVLTGLSLGVIYFLVEAVKHGAGEVFRNLRREGGILFATFMTTVLSDIFLVSAMAVPGAYISLIIPLKRTSTFMTTLMAGRLFHEHRIGMKLAGCAVMIVGVVLIVL